MAIVAVEVQVFFSAPNIHHEIVALPAIFFIVNIQRATVVWYNKADGALAERLRRGLQTF